MIADDAQALAVAAEVSAQLSAGAAERDAQRILPAEQMELLSERGLMSLTVPARFGGPDVSIATLTEVFRLLAAGDPNVGQIPQSHYVYLNVLRDQGTDAQQHRLFGEVLAGARFANAQTERSTKYVGEDATSLTRDGDGWRLRGEKFYCTGSLFAHRLAVRATVHPLTDPPTKAVAFVSRDTPGVTVVDDWDAMGQRTTGSGTVRLEDVLVPDDLVVPFTPIFTRPTTYGAEAQILHAALDAGIAAAALREAVACVAKARPWFESGADTADADPLTVQTAGEVTITVRAADAVLADAARAVDVARANPTDGTCADASIAVATAKVLCGRAALVASSALFELGGTRAASGSADRDRFWRDARTHTLHDPERWKIQHIGRWTLTGTPPPRHGLL